MNRTIGYFCALTLLASPLARALQVDDGVYHPGQDDAVLHTAEMSADDAREVLHNVIQVQDEVRPTKKPEPDIKFNWDDVTGKYKDFDVIVLINKAAKGQTIDVFRFGKWVKHGLVSTGLETYVPSDDIFAQTYAGYYTVEPGNLSIDHHSSQFQDAHMPYAVFFNDGEATHKAPPGDEQYLGHRKSHGCVRNTAENASDIFWMVSLAGGPFNPKNFTAWCRLSKDEVQGIQVQYADNPAYAKQAVAQAQAEHLAECKSDPNWQALTQNYQTQGQRALEMGAQEIGPGHENGLPYATFPDVPNVDPNTGDFVMDATTNQIQTHKGYKALYVVENVPPQISGIQSMKDPRIPTTLLFANSRLVAQATHLAAQVNYDMRQAQQQPPTPTYQAPWSMNPRSDRYPPGYQQPGDPIGNFFRHAFGQH